jgi:hypothetical protein
MLITRLHTANRANGYGVTGRRLWTTLLTVQSDAQGCPSLLTPYEMPSWPVVWNRHQHEASCCLLAMTLDTSFFCPGIQAFMPQWDTYLNFVFYIVCDRLIIYHLIQKLYSQQQTITCHFPVCLVHVAASKWPSSGRPAAKEYSNDRFCSRCAYVESK